MPADRRMTDAEIRRKTNKPIMEKKRRERINKCLEDLKAIVLTSVTDENRPNKLEKADILEMTVRYLKSIQNDKTQSVMQAASRLNQSDDRINMTDSEPVLRHKGYTQCIHEVTSFLSQSEGVPVEFRTQLLGHLADKYNPVPEDQKAHKSHQRRSREAYAKPTAIRPLNNGFITELDIQRQAQLQSTRIEDVHTPIKMNALNGYGQAIHPTRFSPIPVSPISASSHTSLRHAPSPSLSASSIRSESSIDTSNNNTDLMMFNSGVNSACFSPSEKMIPGHRFRLAEGTHYNSSDSGNWSSGSGPPSPIPVTTMKLTMQTTCGNFKKSIKVENNVPAMWRPWGL